VFLVCFSLVCQASFENIITDWWPEITHHCPRAKIILVGTKLDLVDNNAIRQQLLKKKCKPISTEQGAALARKIGAHKYIETSALTQRNLNKLIQEAVRAVLAEKGIRVPRQMVKKSGRTCILC